MFFTFQIPMHHGGLTRVEETQPLSNVPNHGNDHVPIKGYCVIERQIS